MRIGSIELDTPLIFAPLAGITNLPLRLLARKAGCGLVCSEMISANGLAFGAAKTRRMLESTAAERPLCIQIFGSDPSIMAEAARQVEAAGADIIDINCGCSVRKILKSNSGAALMREPQNAAAVFKAVREAVRIPMTVKMRSGWDPTARQAIELAQIAQDCGADAVTVHPRTARQGFAGSADWAVIARVKALLTIPVVGNGDVVTPEDALRMRAQTGCDAVMIGRAAIGNPLLFRQVRALLEGNAAPVISLDERFDLMVRYVRDSMGYLGQATASRVLRSRLVWFVKGLPRATHFRESIRRIESQEQALDLIAGYRQAIAAAVSTDAA